MPQSLSNNLIHLVFSTKNRKRFIQNAVRCDLHAYMTAVLKNLKCSVLIINSVEDHVHILFKLHRTIALSNAIRDLKLSSSKWIKTQADELADFTWQAGFGAFSVSESKVPSVKTYIANQAEHHRTFSFQDELRSLLVKHKLKFEECYLWD